MPENESIKEAIEASEAQAIHAVNQSHILSLASSLHAPRIPIWEEQDWLNADTGLQANGSR